MPADIYRSGIEIAINGVEVQTKLGKGDNGTSKSSRKRSRNGDIIFQVSEDERLPTTEDISQSFLEEEPLDERRELEAAFASQSTHLVEESQTLSEASEEDAGFGTGLGFTLPDFLTNMLNGIADRLQVTISDVILSLKTEITPDSYIPGNSIEGIHPAALQLRAESAEVQGLTSSVIETDSGSGVSSQRPHRQEKRRIRLNKISVGIESSPDLFQQLEKSTDAPSPVLSKRSKWHDRTPSNSSRAVSSPASSPTTNRSVMSASIYSTVQPPRSFLDESVHSPPHQLNPSEQATRYDEHERFADSSVDDIRTLGLPQTHSGQNSDVLGLSGSGRSLTAQNERNSALNTSLARLFASSSPVGPHDSREEDMVSTPDLDNSAALRYLGNHDSYLGEQETSIQGSVIRETDDATSVGSKSQLSSRSQPTEATQSHDGDGFSRLGRSDHLSKAGTSPHSDSRSSSSGRSLDNDLLESKLFTTEEAESMYMSAMSQLQNEAKMVGSKSGLVDEELSADPRPAPVDDEPTVESDTARPQGGPTIEDFGFETPRARSPTVSTSSGPSQVPQSPPVERSSDSRTDGSTMDVRKLNCPEARLILPILTIQGITARLPWTGTQSVVENNPENTTQAAHTSYHQSVHHTMPGAFSQYEDHGSKLNRRPQSPHSRVNVTPQPAEQDNTEETKSQPVSPFETQLEVEIDDIDIAIDLSAGGLLLSVLQPLISAFGGSNPDSERKESSAPQQDTNSSTMRILSFAVSRLTLTLLERLHAQSPSSPQESSGLAIDHSTALLRLEMQQISAIYRQQIWEAFAKVDVEKFLFGFSDERIISFDSESALLSSRRELNGHNHAEISLTYRQDKIRGQEVEIFTIPVVVNFRMSKFDDRLSCFGGLSGILDLSSSITSNGTVHNANQHRKGSSKGVRFAGHSELASANVLSPIKMNARIEGVSFSFEGRACGVKLDTSAVKVAVREQAAKVRISEIMIRGPQHDVSAHSALNLRLDNLAVLFQLTPQEEDLEELVSLITPSRDKYEDDDDILLHTLLLQRRKGSLVKIDISKCAVNVRDINSLLQFQSLGDEFSKLSTVTKYLPEDDRPGILSMIDVTDIEAEVNINNSIGKLHLHSHRSRAAHVGFPALLAVELGKISLSRNKTELLVGPCLGLREEDSLPMVMARQIGDELEPKVKVKLYNLVAEYRVSALIALMDAIGGTREDLATTMAASVVNINTERSPFSVARQPTDATETSRSSTTALHLDLLLRDCALGLNPVHSDERGLVLLTDARVSANMSARENLKLGLEVRKASILLVDDISCLNLSAPVALRPKSSSQTSPAFSDLCRQGYASIASVSSASIVVQAAEAADGSQLLHIDVSDKLLVLEACADSLKTLASLGSGLAPPSPPGKVASDQTHLMPISNLMASFSGEAFVKPESEDEDKLEDADHILDDLPANLDFVGSFYEPDSENSLDGRHSPSSDTSQSTVTIGTDDLKPDPPFTQALEDKFEFDNRITSLVIIQNYLDVAGRNGAARGWNSKTGKYGMLFESQTKECPLRVRVNLGTVIVNMFDGYDWIKTREAIAKAVDDVQEKAERRRKQRQSISREDDEEESEVGDFLFQSIWIAVPPNREATDLRKQINRQIDDDIASETGSVTTATKTQLTGRPPLGRKSRTLRLERGKKKVSVELSDLDADVLVLPPSLDETRLNIDVRVRNLEVYDHVPSSTWNKLATCLIDPQERQVDKPQLHIEILGVKPLPDTPNLEFVVKVEALPVSLHVDQDTQDFVQRFGSFTDESEVKHSDGGADFFIQRIEIDSIPVRFDYKPKRLDYAGLRSGRTGELMNLMTLDGTSFVLRHLILHGIEGGDHLHKSLHSIWMGDILQNQLPGVLAGLAPIRPLVNVGTGIQNLVVVPMREYRKDGRIVRSIQKGAVAFARTTTRELARLGARVAIGTQNILEGTEGLLSPHSSSPIVGVGRERGIDDDWDEDFVGGSPGATEKRVISNYANQPLNVVTGVRAAYRGLEKDLMTARDAIIAIGMEVRESDSARGVAGAIARHGPAVILRPAIGTTRAIGTALLGAGNMLDKDSQRKMEEVCYPHPHRSSFDSLTRMLSRNTSGISNFHAKRSSAWNCQTVYKRTVSIDVNIEA